MKALNKYLQIIASGFIEEKQILSLRSFINKNKQHRLEIWQAWDDSELSISDSQTEKGINFLLDQWKTPKGIERKNNPFGYREQEILSNFSHFRLKSLYNAGNGYTDNYLPLYSVYDHEGNYFEYYYNGKINIVG